MSHFDNLLRPRLLRIKTPNIPEICKNSWNINHGPLARYIKLPVAHAPGMPGTFSPPPRVSDPDMHHGTCVTHVPWCMPGSLTSVFFLSRWWGKTFPAFPAHAQPANLLSGKRPMMKGSTYKRNIVVCQPLQFLQQSGSPCHPTNYSADINRQYWEVDTMTSSNGNIFRVPGPLCREFTGHRWIPHTKASDVELWCFLWSALE